MIDPTTIVFPSHDGNGMFLSMGNIAGDGRIGLLFMDFERPHRVRAHAHAVVSHDEPLMNPPRRRHGPGQARAARVGGTANTTCGAGARHTD